MLLPNRMSRNRKLTKMTTMNRLMKVLKFKNQSQSQQVIAATARASRPAVSQRRAKVGAAHSQSSDSCLATSAARMIPMCGTGNPKRPCRLPRQRSPYGRRLWIPPRSARTIIIARRVRPRGSSHKNFSIWKRTRMTVLRKARSRLPEMSSQHDHREALMSEWQHRNRPPRPRQSLPRDPRRPADVPCQNLPSAVACQVRPSTTPGRFLFRTSAMSTTRVSRPRISPPCRRRRLRTARRP
mmetsp:Transcript_10622/g.30323  ORF Transcript_10622/g.30323 Transcript_10622/m.30323 type:complete len:240 (-) Transcript_10622:1377-2096(-)